MLETIPPPQQASYRLPNGLTLWLMATLASCLPNDDMASGQKGVRLAGTTGERMYRARAGMQCVGGTVNKPSLYQPYTTARPLTMEIHTCPCSQDT